MTTEISITTEDIASELQDKISENTNLKLQNKALERTIAEQQKIIDQNEMSRCMSFQNSEILGLY